MKAEVRMYGGTPTIYLDDQPVFGGINWLGGMDRSKLQINQEVIRKYSAAGIHIYSLDAISTEWCGPQAEGSGLFDFSPVGPRLQEILDADPDALFLLRLGFELRGFFYDWWRQMFPDECEVLSDGKRVGQTYASTIWQDQVKAFLRGYIAELRRTGMYERVIAYQVATGTCGEWIKDELSMGLVCGDYSQPMLRYFQTWLAEKYQGDLSAFQQAWADPQVTFETAQVPTADEQLHTTHFLFRDSQKERKVIDFYECFADLSADAMLGFCRLVKEETHNEKLTGAFFGYLMEISWNNAFFGNVDVMEASEVSTIQRCGHLGLHKALRSPDVDFFVSPMGYAFRGLGGDALPMQPSESLRVHGKIYLMEEDSTMHNYFDPGGRMHTLDNSIAIYQRNFGQVITHGLGVTWLESDGFPEDPRIVPQAAEWIRRFEQLGRWSLCLDRRPAAETAVFLDDHSFFYQSIHNNIDIPLIWQQRVVNLNRFGAPHDVYLLNDLLEGRLPPYKLYIFLNAFQLDRGRRQALKQAVRQQGRVALWLYAPGYLDENGPAVENMTDLTGFHFARGDQPWGPFMHVTNFQHTITKGIPQDLFWGTTQTLGPLFHLEDPQATTLGEIVYSLGRCKPGLAVKEFNDGQGGTWSSVYSGTPNVPAPVLRGIARYAGVNLYSDAGDVLYATPELLCVHTTSGGARNFQLPGKVEVVFDLFHGQFIAHDTDHFQATLAPASTALYFTGKKSLLDGVLGIY
jgi:hypothetical protein